MILAIILLIREVIEDHNTDAAQFIKAFIVLFIFASVELIGFALGDYQNTSLFLSLGVAILMIILLINYTRYVIQRMKLSHEKELYEKLAYMDHVTQGQNRLAFERDLDEIFKDPIKREQLRLILFDLDELKSINDAYGHVVGDQAIKEAFDIIMEAFNDHGMCYRIGGDEFACLYQTTDDDQYQNKKKFIDEKTKAFEDATPYHFGLSYGSATIVETDMSSKDLIHQADIDMYQHKKNRKSST
jgi:diguanylate cyclase (GGDEF)-like protein